VIAGKGERTEGKALSESAICGQFSDGFLEDPMGHFGSFEIASQFAEFY